MSSVTSHTLVCRQNLGVFSDVMPSIQTALAHIDLRKRTYVDKYLILDRESDPKFATPGQNKKIFFCVERDLIQGTFTVHLALRSPIHCPHFAKEKKAYTLLQGAQGVIHPLLIKQQGRFDYLITDLFNEGELYNFIIHKISHVPTHRTEMLIYALVCAVIEHHAKGIIHRDIKPENILIRQLENGMLDAKIIDFGMAFFMAEDSKKEAFHHCGSAHYISKEDWHSLHTTGWLLPADYSRDAWALGLVLFAITTGELPGQLEVADNGLPLGLSLHSKKQFRLGLFEKEISELVYGCRTKLPPLTSIQKRMKHLLLCAYPTVPSLQNLPVMNVPSTIPKWQKDERELLHFIGKALVSQTASDGSLYDLIHSYWSHFQTLEETTPETIVFKELANLKSPH